MKRVWMLILGLVTLLGARADLARAQGGSLMGRVRTVDMPVGSTLEYVTVRIDRLDESIVGYHRETYTTASGFSFDSLPPGVYTVQTSWLGLGFAAEVAEVLVASSTVMELVLNGGPGTGAEPPMVQVQGIVRVRQDSTGFLRYFLVIPPDTSPQYRLLLGSNHYAPHDSTMQRPINGDRVVIGGRLFGYSDPPLMVVYTINSAVWRDPTYAEYGGDGGPYYDGLGCDSSMVRVEFTGIIGSTIAMGDSSAYYLYVATDSTIYILDFGGLSFRPEQGVVRPTSNDSVVIVGGLAACPGPVRMRIVAYEVNGVLWRLPGDVVGLGPSVSPVDPPHDGPLPVSQLLVENYPNPFNATTTIRFALPHAGRIKLVVFDLEGREVARLADGIWPAGTHTAAWNGAAHASGLYFCALELDGARAVQRMLLLK